MRFASRLVSFNSFVVTALAACGDPDTIPTIDTSIRVYSQPECTGRFQDIGFGKLEICWFSQSVGQEEYFAVSSAASAITNPSVACTIFSLPQCQGEPLVTIDKSGNETLYTIPRYKKLSVRCLWVGEE